MTTLVVLNGREEPREGLLPARARPGWLPASTIGLIAAGLALLLPLLSLRVTDAPGWVARYALLPIEAAIGLPLLFALLATSFRRAAIAAFAFIVVASLATVFSDNPAISFWGNEFFGSGLLFVLALCGAWAIGVCSGPDGPRFVERALLIGVLVNAVVAVVQVFADLTRFGAQSLGVQPTGLMGQPAHLAALLLGGLWLLARRVDTGRWYIAASVVLVAASIEVTAERFPLLLCILVVIAVVWRKPIRTKALVVGLVVAGVVIGVGLTQQMTDRQSATSRLAGDVGSTPRTENYRGGLEAIGERPLLGWGPARYVAATAPKRTEALERSDPDSIFVDAHNWPLHWAVTTGLVGLAALAVWLALAARHARANPALLGFAACIGVVQLVQPQDVAVTVLAVLALGAAAAIPAPRQIVPLVGRIVLVAGAVFVSALVLVGGWYAYRGRTNPADAAKAASMLPHWPERAEMAARRAPGNTDLSTQQAIGEVKRWTAEAIARDNRDPRTVGQSGFDLLFVADYAGAEQVFGRLLPLDPNSPNTLLGLGAAEYHLGMLDAAVEHLERANAIKPNDKSIMDTLAAARAKQSSGN